MLERGDERPRAAHSNPVLADRLGHREAVDLVPGQVLGHAETRLLGRVQDLPGERRLVRESRDSWNVYSSREVLG